MRCSKLERGAQRVMELINFHSLSASEAARLIREGVISSERLMEACLARIREVDERVQAWAFLDPDHAIAWMMRKNQPALKMELDAFMKKMYKGTFYTWSTNISKIPKAAVRIRNCAPIKEVGCRPTTSWLRSTRVGKSSTGV